MISAAGRTLLLCGLMVVPCLGITVETVPVGNPGNVGELSAGRICGAVEYTYNMGTYEVTAGQYTAFLNAVAAADPYGLYNTFMANTSHGSGISRNGSPGSYTYAVDPAFVSRPVNYVGWGDAARFANWLHNGRPAGAQTAGTTEDGAYTLKGATSGASLAAVPRNSQWKWAIPSEDEWYKAAYHKNDGATGNYWAYPTSSDTAPGRDLDDALGNNANYFGPTWPIDPPYYTTVAGQFRNSPSPYGTFDQGGNVWEWTEATDDLGRCLRGGSWYHYVSLLDAASGNFNYFFPGGTQEGSFHGFRVVEVPEPATITLLVLSSLGVSRIRRRD